MGIEKVRKKRETAKNRAKKKITPTEIDNSMHKNQK